ncbi:AfsA-related hotdog domain-containing protein [Nocardiopsis sp. YSL2]|uniref:AfsA-related hotdog domain-containing protein n=1 Tax=Nocardiopsis sp. YSL2 TaxID=2939492 RepID=UPI0026F47BDD|nr:AfsA-related hotdog domain-containing protein [Nocardiopsis sp. YSL2]
MSDALWVVGDACPTALPCPGVRTLGDIHRALSIGELRHVRLVPSLGVGPLDWDHLADRVAGAGLVGSVTLAAPPPRPVARAEVSVPAQEDVVVAAPWIDDGTVEFALAVADGNRVMREHAGRGRQLPGELLVEAAIQGLTWAARALYPVERGQPPVQPVLYGFGFEFHRPLFWLPVTVRITLSETGPPDPRRRPLTAEIAYLQRDRTCARGHVGFQACDPRSVQDTESAQSRAVGAPPARRPGRTAGEGA